MSARRARRDRVRVLSLTARDLSGAVLHCMTCPAVTDPATEPEDAARWNHVWLQGRVTMTRPPQRRGGRLHVWAGNCPDCQTPEENAEAEVNLATLDYSRAVADESGRLWAPPRGASDDDAEGP